MYLVLIPARQVRDRKRLGSLLLCSFSVFRALINSLLIRVNRLKCIRSQVTRRLSNRGTVTAEDDWDEPDQRHKLRSQELPTADRSMPSGILHLPTPRIKAAGGTKLLIAPSSQPTVEERRKDAVGGGGGISASAFTFPATPPLISASRPRSHSASSLGNGSLGKLGTDEFSLSPTMSGGGHPMLEGFPQRINASGICE